MRFEGILKEYLEVIATGCRRFIHPKRGGNRNCGLVCGLFPVHATGPLNTSQKNEKEIKEMKRNRADKRSGDAIAIPKEEQYHY